MSEESSFERLSEIQNEILMFTIEQVNDSVDKLYIQGKITDDGRGNVTWVQGNLRNVAVGSRVLDVSGVLDDAAFEANVGYVRPRIIELHDLLCTLQGKSPVRFRWCVDTKSGQVDSGWTYYDDLTDEEKTDDFWESWKADFAWHDQLQAELNAKQGER